MIDYDAVLMSVFWCVVAVYGLTLVSNGFKLWLASTDRASAASEDAARAVVAMSDRLGLLEADAARRGLAEGGFGRRL